MCNKIKLFIFIFFLFTTKIWAKSHVLIISGDTKESRFKKNAELVAKKAKEEGREVYIAAGKGKKWSFADQGNNFSAVIKRDLRTDQLKGANFERMLKKIGSKLKEGDSLTLMITGHGMRPFSEAEPETGAIAMAEEKIKSSVGEEIDYPHYLRYFELEELIKKHIPSHAKVKIVANMCFGGGTHTISSNLPNVCSSSITDYRSYGWSVRGRTAASIKGFWAGGQDSLFARHFAALASDRANDGRGSLSSEAFLDEYLKEGAYDLTKHGKEVTERSISPLSLNMALSSAEYSAYQVPSCPLTDFAVPKIEALGNLATFMEDNLSYDIAHLPKVPQAIKKAVADAKKRWREGEFLAEEKNYAGQFLNLKNEWHQFSPEQKELNRKFYNEKFDNLNKKANTALHRLLVHYKLVQYGKKINKFLASNPSEKDKKTLWRLMECEVEAL